MFRASFAIVVLGFFLASSSTASAGSVVFPATGPLFDTGDPTLKVTLLNGADSLAATTLTPLPDAAAASPLIAGEVIFTMIVAGGGPLSNVGFQYGADGVAPKLPAGMRAPAAIPEPATLVLLASGLGLALRQRLRKDRAQRVRRA